MLMINTDYMTNMYHYGSVFRKGVVKKANEKRFTCSGSIDIEGSIAGINEGSVYRQQNGKALYGGRVFLHAVKDRDQIVRILNEGVEQACSKVDKDYAEAISKEEIALKRIRAKIANLKNRTTETLYTKGLDAFEKHHKSTLDEFGIKVAEES